MAETAEEVKVAREKQNGVTRPNSGTKTGRVWELADELSQTTSEDGEGDSLRAALMKAGEAEGLVAATISTQLGRWRRFHGLVKEKAAAE